MPRGNRSARGVEVDGGPEDDSMTYATSTSGNYSVDDDASSSKPNSRSLQQQRDMTHPENQKHHTSAASIMNDLNDVRQIYQTSPKNKEPVVIRHIDGKLRSGSLSPSNAATRLSSRNSKQFPRVNDLEAQMKKVSRHLNKERKTISIHTNHDEGSDGCNSCTRSFFSNHITKILILIILYGLIITGIAAWLFKRFNEIPGLNSEINALSEQVFTLKLEVDRLNDFIETLDDQVDRLEAANSDLEDIQENLEEENKVSKGLIVKLNNTNTEFGSLNGELQRENARYFDYTQSLNATVQQLVSDLAASTTSKEELAKSLEDYKEIRETLQEEVNDLSDTAGDLNYTVQELNKAIEDFQEENERFRIIVTFLEDEANEVEKSYTELTEALAETILRKNALAEIAVEERMKAELAGWECGLVTAFGTKQFAQNVDLPIGYTHYNDVMEYVQDKLLSDFCVTTPDLESYLKKEIQEQGQSLWTISLSDLTRGANSYTNKVLDYYFPDEGETGLDSESWDAANHDCTNLPDDKFFVYN